MSHKIHKHSTLNGVDGTGKGSYVGPTQNRLTVNRSEAAALLGISERLLWTWTNAGRIPHLRIGARVLYPLDGLRQWLEEQTQSSD